MGGALSETESARCKKGEVGDGTSRWRTDCRNAEDVKADLAALIHMAAVIVSGKEN